MLFELFTMIIRNKPSITKCGCAHLRLLTLLGYCVQISQHFTHCLLYLRNVKNLKLGDQI